MEDIFSFAMDLSLRILSQQRKIHSAFNFSNRVLDISHSAGRGNSITLSKWQHDDIIEGQPVPAIATWNSFQDEEFGSCVALDTQNDLVFASLRDRRRIATFPVSSEDLVKNTAIFPLDFASPLFALRTLTLSSSSADRNNDVIFAISSTGEIEAFCSEAGEGKAEKNIRWKKVKALPLESVLFVSYFESDHLLIIGMREDNIFLLALKFSIESNFEVMKFEEMPEIQLPRPPSSAVSSKTIGDSFVLGFLMKESYSFILYSGGFVHILSPNSTSLETKCGTLRLWYPRKKGLSEKEPVVIAKPSHAFRLSPGTVEDNSVAIAGIWKGRKEDAGDVADLGGSYVAIGYGQYVSIWDGIYKVDHGIQQISGHVTAICPRSGKALVASEEGFIELTADNSSPVSLGLAVRRKGSCDAVVSKMQQPSDEVPIHSQPVIVRAAKVAAEAGSPERVFNRLLKSLDGEEMEIVRALVNRETCSSAEAVAKLTQHYTMEYKKVRRGNRGKSTDLGLSNLPSERLAAVSVARCLYEIHFGHGRYVVPLIDMIGTGVVSNEAVLAVVELSDSWQMGPAAEPLVLRSIVDPLITSPTFLNSLEAIVSRVADLPEGDIVRIVQFAVRMIQSSSPSSDEEGSMTDAPDSTASFLRSRQHLQATHLLFSCVNASVDKSRVVQALRQVPLADIIRILGRFDHILSDISSSSLQRRKKPRQVPSDVKRGFFGPSGGSFDITLYRGVGNWLDQEGNANLIMEAGDMGVSGVIQWTCHVIDAHLATLIMDASGRELASGLLKTVRHRKRELEVLRSLEGLTSHLVGKHPLPTQDPLYSNTTIEVPMYAALK